MKTRQTLLERVRDRTDDRSWKEFDEIYRPYIFRILRRMHFTIEEAEDECQSILLTLWEKIPDFQYNFRTGAFRKWIATIVRNRAINVINKNETRRDKLTQENAESFRCLLPDNKTELEKIVEDEWFQYLSEIAWNKIKTEFKEKQLKAFTMNLEGLPNEHISIELGMSVDSIYVYKNKIKKRLEQTIKSLKIECL
ncbi:MAG: sigma-70 family RNA polymerase sigma factor [Lentisphaeraceae bacterium]|nr:sigma-70 family RNA polymerase sigma factor [Lentisphaeraceae bacterium]